MARLRRGGGSYPVLRTVLNMWTTSIWLHSGEMSGYLFGCGGALEQDAPLSCVRQRALCAAWPRRECAKLCLVFASFVFGLNMQLSMAQQTGGVQRLTAVYLLYHPQE